MDNIVMSPQVILHLNVLHFTVLIKKTGWQEDLFRYSTVKVLLRAVVMMDGMFVPPNSSKCHLNIERLAVKPEVCATWTFVPLMAVTDKASFLPPGLFHDGQHIKVFSCDIQKMQLSNKVSDWQFLTFHLLWPLMSVLKPCTVPQGLAWAKKVGSQEDLAYRLMSCTKKATLLGVNGKWTQEFAQL